MTTSVNALPGTKPIEALNRVVEIASSFCVSQVFFTACKLGLIYNASNSQVIIILCVLTKSSLEKIRALLTEADAGRGPTKEVMASLSKEELILFQTEIKMRTQAVAEALRQRGIDIPEDNPPLKPPNPS